MLAPFVPACSWRHPPTESLPEGARPRTVGRTVTELVRKGELPVVPQVRLGFLAAVERTLGKRTPGKRALRTQRERR